MTRNLILGAVFLSVSLMSSAWAQTGGRATETLTSVIASSGLNEIKPYLAFPKGKVVKVSGGVVYLTNATGVLIKKGTSLEIVRDKEIIKHPVTGERLGAITGTVGKVKVLSSDKNLIVASPITGGAKIKKGDSIGGAPNRDPRVAVVMFLSLDSWEKSDVIAALISKLAAWDGISWVPPYVVERFLFDENITGRTNLLSGETFKTIRKRLQVDYLVLLDVKEESKSILTDVAVFRVTDSQSPMAAFKGLAHKSEMGYVRTASKREPAASQPAPKISRPSTSPPAGKQIVQPAAKAPVPKTVEREERSVNRPKPRSLSKFKERIAALLIKDLDADGKDEIVVGFDHEIAVFEIRESGLEKIWKKSLSSRNQILGLSAGDFNGNGKVEIYVNNAASSRIRSLVIEGSGSSYQVISENQNLLFFAGQDGKLYGQGQTNDFSLENRLMEISWNNGGFDKKPFLTLPKNAGLNGFGFTDLDGDNITDIVAYTRGHGLAYYLSEKKEWASATGDFGGSIVQIKLYYDDDDTEIFQDFLGPVLFTPARKGGYAIVVVRNTAPTMLVSNPTFTKSQIVTLEFDGLTYVAKSETPMARGVISASAFFRENGAELLLIARNYPGYIRKTTSELILTDPGR